MQPHNEKHPFPRLSMAEKLVVIVSTGLILLLALLLVAIHLGMVVYA